MIIDSEDLLQSPFRNHKPLFPFEPVNSFVQNTFIKCSQGEMVELLMKAKTAFSRLRSFIDG